mmetsp:Transcript_7748/g.13968  ORF Transcript_7748/g.13968 Transcript_7748/m.13968 type:complete len:260 (-) Transcript_7748:180-959(-)
MSSIRSLFRSNSLIPIWLAIVLQGLSLCQCINIAGAFVGVGSVGVTNRRQTGANNGVILKASMKDAAIPLMDAGKALARSGELWIEWTALSETDLYHISSAGASIRNAGDCVAQAAASCRFKTGLELVCDELREAGTCLTEGNTQMTSFNSKSNEEANAPQLSAFVASTMEPLKESGRLLEEAGACIMRRQSVAEVGQCFLDCSDNLSLLASAIEPMALESSQRMTFAAKRMKDAGQSLKPSSASENETKPKGKAWLQG